MIAGQKLRLINDLNIINTPILTINAIQLSKLFISPEYLYPHTTIYTKHHLIIPKITYVRNRRAVVVFKKFLFLNLYLFKLPISPQALYFNLIGL